MIRLTGSHPTLQNYIASFLIDRRAKRLSSKTIRFYQDYLNYFSRYLFNEFQITAIESITPDALRQFMLVYEEGHNPGGCHAMYRSIRAMLRWYEAEYEPENYKSPLRKVKAPKVPKKILPPVSNEDVGLLLAACKGSLKLDKRDYAIFLALYDTGVRANELLALKVEDVNLATGEILVKQGKGGKSRSVFAGKQTCKAIRIYLKSRTEGYVFLTRSDERMHITGLRKVIESRAKKAGIKPPTLHSFRRAFAINCLRAGMDIFSLQRLMGHSDLSVLYRYLAQTNDDLKTAHRAASPGDRLEIPRVSKGALAGQLFNSAGVPVKNKE